MSDAERKKGGSPLSPEFADQAAAASSVSLGVSAVLRLKASKKSTTLLA